MKVDPRLIRARQPACRCVPFARNDEDGRRRVFDMAPEVEQRHDTAMTGAAVIIDVSTIDGTSPKGPVLVVAK